MGSLRAGVRKNGVGPSPGGWELPPSAPPSILPALPHLGAPSMCPPWPGPGERETHPVLEGLSLYPEEGARSFQEEVLLEGGLKGEGS